MNIQTFYYINENCIFDDNGLIFNYYDNPPETLIDFCVSKTGLPMPEKCNTIFDIIFYMTNFKYNSDNNIEQDIINKDTNSEYTNSEYNFENIEDDMFSCESNEWINIE